MYCVRCLWVWVCVFVYAYVQHQVHVPTAMMDTFIYVVCLFVCVFAYVYFFNEFNFFFTHVYIFFYTQEHKTLYMYIFSLGAARVFVCALLYVWERGGEGESEQRPVRVATTWIHKCSACGVRIVCVCICVLMCMLSNGWVGGCVCVYVSAATTWTRKCIFYSAVYIYAFTFIHKHTRMLIFLMNAMMNANIHVCT